MRIGVNFTDDYESSWLKEVIFDSESQVAVFKKRDFSQQIDLFNIDLALFAKFLDHVAVTGSPGKGFNWLKNQVEVRNKNRYSQLVGSLLEDASLDAMRMVREIVDDMIEEEENELPF